MSVNPKTVITDLLHDVPAYVRRAMLVTYSLAIMIFTILKIFEVDLDYDAIAKAMLVIGGYLGIQESVNIEDRRAHDPGDSPVV